ncbi:MAG: primosomal protein N' [Oceanospirillum sp.]|nr:primosomal protein N' [Oceanospirillum sp.]
MPSLFDDELSVIRVALPVPLRRCFDYVIPPQLQNSYLPVGARVRVPYRNRELIGVIMQRQVTPDVALEKLKPIAELLDDASLLSEEQLQLAQWLARYCHGPIGEVIALMLPPLLRQGGAAHIQEETYWQATLSGYKLDPQQIRRASKQAALLKELQKHQQPVAATVLRSLGFALSQMTALEDKGLVCRHQQSKHLTRSTASSAILAEVPLVLNKQQQFVVDRVLGRSTVTDDTYDDANKGEDRSGAEKGSKEPSQALKDLLQKQDGVSVAEQTVVANTADTFLLEGITGSGKTEVYLQIAAEILKQQRQVLVLVPEIGLAPQTVQRFKKRFALPVLTFHSGLNEKERLDAWLLARDGKARILIGTRSAVLAPFHDLGLIIVDEEHDASYKQGDGIRYSARDLAVVRGKMSQVPVLLGSATPSLESLYNVETGRYHGLQLTQRAGETSQLPKIYLHDIKNRRLQQGVDFGLLQVMRQHLESNGQVLVFINRRGFAPTLMCHDCGWIAQCNHCDARMTLHKEPPRLHCHHCDTVRAIPQSCPKCGKHDLKPVGSGTERTEEALERALSDWPVLRIDRDSVSRKGAMEKVLDQVRSGKPCVLVGTQMLAKGHHFPEVSLVVVLDADGGFYSADFRGLERMGQLLTQVAGRAGRASRKGKVVVQTHHPEDELLKLLAKHNYSEFSRQLLGQRQDALLPPYTYMALLRAEAPRREDVESFLQQIMQAAESQLTLMYPQGLPDLERVGPLPSPMERRFGRYHMQIWLQASRRAALHQYLEILIRAIEMEPLSRKVRWSLDVDPQETL